MDKRFNKYNYGLCGCSLYDFKNKEDSNSKLISYMLNRTQSMFEYENLPDTISKRVLELYLQINGNCCFYNINDNLYVFTGGLGGELDVYYMPTIYTISNPALNISKSLKIDEECIVVSNDSLYLGLMPLFNRYSSALVENEISMQLASINARITSLISAGDDRTAKSAEKYLKDIADGKLGVIAENAFLDGVKSQPYGNTANSNTLTNLIEYEQYLKASWYNEIGLNANYNMKRESLNSNESQLNDDMLLPLIDNMFECRQIGIEKVNNMFGTDISVKLNSSWEDNQKEIELIQNSIRVENETGDIDETANNIE